VVAIFENRLEIKEGCGIAVEMVGGVPAVVSILITCNPR
jgi:hypothetical protein